MNLQLFPEKQKLKNGRFKSRLRDRSVPAALRSEPRRHRAHQINLNQGALRFREYSTGLSPFAPVPVFPINRLFDVSKFHNLVGLGRFMLNSR